MLNRVYCRGCGQPLAVTKRLTPEGKVTEILYQPAGDSSPWQPVDSCPKCKRPLRSESDLSQNPPKK